MSTTEYRKGDHVIVMFPDTEWQWATVIEDPEPDKPSRVRVRYIGVDAGVVAVNTSVLRHAAFRRGDLVLVNSLNADYAMQGEVTEPYDEEDHVIQVRFADGLVAWVNADNVRHHRPAFNYDEAAEDNEGFSHTQESAIRMLSREWRDLAFFLRQGSPSQATESYSDALESCAVRLHNIVELHR